MVLIHLNLQNVKLAFSSQTFRNKFILIAWSNMRPEWYPEKKSARVQAENQLRFQAPEAFAGLIDELDA